MNTQELTNDVLESHAICAECGHDCTRAECEDRCTCVDEFDDELDFYDDLDYRIEYDDGHGDY